MEPKSESQSVQRKRGRPAGKNHVPLSLEERRARNAQYERERREETAQAVAMLAEAAGCEPNLSLMVLLDRVTSFLKEEGQRGPSDDITLLRSFNEKLMRQIITLEERLRRDDADISRTASSHGPEEVPIRTNSNQVLIKRVKLERPTLNVYPTPSPESLPDHAPCLDTSLTLDTVLDDVISLEEETLIQREESDYNPLSTSSVLDDVISLEEESKFRTDQKQIQDGEQRPPSDYF